MGINIHIYTINKSITEETCTKLPPSEWNTIRHAGDSDFASYMKGQAFSFDDEGNM